MCEGSELLVHDGPSEGPLWRETLDAPIVALGADDTRICAVTKSGMVAWFAARKNERLGTASFDMPVERAIIDAPNRRVIAITATSIVELTDGAEPKELAAHSARAIAYRSDSGIATAPGAAFTVLAATASNELVTLSSDGTRTVKQLPEPIHALAWHPAKFWVVGLEGKVYRWDDGGAELGHITSLPKGSVLDAIACCDRAIALAWDRDTVVSMAWPSKDTLGSLTYVERRVEGIDFGPWPWLGIALDLGDGNKHNLDRPEALHRSDTHPGRQHHSWLVQVGGMSGGPSKKAPAPAAPAVVAKNKTSPLIALAVIAIVAAVLFGMLHH